MSAPRSHKPSPTLKTLAELRELAKAIRESAPYGLAPHSWGLAAAMVAITQGVMSGLRQRLCDDTVSRLQREDVGRGAFARFVLDLELKLPEADLTVLAPEDRALGFRLKEYLDYHEAGELYGLLKGQAQEVLRVRADHIATDL